MLARFHDQGRSALVVDPFNVGDFVRGHFRQVLAGADAALCALELANLLRRLDV